MRDPRPLDRAWWRQHSRLLRRERAAPSPVPANLRADRGTLPARPLDEHASELARPGAWLEHGRLGRQVDGAEHLRRPAGRPRSWSACKDYYVPV